MECFAKYGLVLFVLCSIAILSCSGSDDPVLKSTAKNGRKYYEAEIYTETNGRNEDRPQSLPNAVAGKYVIPYRRAGSGVLKKSGNEVNWNFWKGDEESTEAEENENENYQKWQPPPQPWNSNDAWAADPMSFLLLQNAMASMKNQQKPVGFLEKIAAEPALLLIAACIPISLLLAAVLPTLIHSMNPGIPTITTTATGQKTRSNDLDLMPYLVPAMEAIGTFGIRSVANPDCVQRIFCQVAQEKVGFHSQQYFKRAASVARFLSTGTWLENFGVKKIVDSLSSGHCEDIPCGHDVKKETAKFKYSQKKDSNFVET